MFRSLPCLPLLKHLHDIHVLNAKLGRCCTLTLLPCDGCRVAQNSPVRYGSDLLLPFLQNAGPNGVRWTAILAQVKYRLLRQEMILNKLDRIVRSLLCKHAATERDCEQRHFVYGNQAGLRFMARSFARQCSYPLVI